MGYRHYLAIIEKDKFKSIDDKFLKQLEDEDGFWGIYALIEKIGTEIYELGKYSEEGFRLQEKKPNISAELTPIYEMIKKHCDEYEYGFNILTKRDLMFIIRCYKLRTVNYWKELLGLKHNKYNSDSLQVRMKQYVESKFLWRKYLIDNRDKYAINGYWSYEYALFNLIHCYKMIDWDKYLLVIYGW